MLCAFAFLGSITIIFPKKGIPITEELTLHFANIDDFLEKDKAIQYKDISFIIDIPTDSIEGTTIVDSTAIKEKIKLIPLRPVTLTNTPII